MGRLSLGDVFLYNDGPRLFSCRNEETGQTYVAVWMGDTEGFDSWMIAPASQGRIRQLKKGRFDVRQLFTASPTGFVYKLALPETQTNPLVQQIPSSSLTDELLPAPGERLVNEQKTMDVGIVGIAAAILVVLIAGTMIEMFILSPAGNESVAKRILINGIEAIVAAVLMTRVIRRSRRTG